MADIGVIFGFSFQGSKEEIAMVKELMTLLIGASGSCDFHETESSISISNGFDPLSPFGTALLGTLNSRETCKREVLEGNGDFTLAPMLIASLFPKSSFDYELKEFTFSGGAGPNAIRARYNGKELTVWLCDESDRSNIDQYGIEVEGDCEEEQVINLLVEMQLAEDFETAVADFEDLEVELFYKLNGPYTLKPARNMEYESSFFEDGDLLDYLKTK